MNLNKLKAKIVERGLNVEALANEMGVDASTMYRKLNNFGRITIGEAVRMKEILKLTSKEATEIFLK